MSTETPNTKQREWWRKFRAVLKSMPKGMEVIVSANGTATAAPDGAVLKALNDGKDAGYADTLLLPSIYQSRLVDGSGGL